MHLSKLLIHFIDYREGAESREAASKQADATPSPCDNGAIISEAFPDPSEWPSPGQVSDSFRQMMTENGPVKCPDGPFPRAEKSNRRFSKAYCTRLLPNGERVERDWLMYSNKTNKVYCFACKLFGGSKQHDSRLVGGYSHWQRVSEVLQKHETGPDHIDAYLAWKELESRLRLGKCIDSQLQNAITSEKERWKAILTRVLDCILFLAERNLALRGKNAELGNPRNGNFLGLIELLARYDTTLAEHVRKIATSKGAVSYLSWCTQNEFLQSISDCVIGKICEQIRAAKYYAVEFDCTPDISKQEQASIIIRHIDINENKEAKIEESFVGFTTVKDTTGKGLAETLVNTLESLGIDLVNCRGQSYDNGSNMSGIHRGVQALIQEKNPEALFMPCASHSLNLLLCDAASSNRQCLSFFGTVQRLYTMFSSSVKRWDILKEYVDITLKPLSETRWEAKLDSVKALRYQLGGICDALEKLELQSKDAKICSEAHALSNEIMRMEFLTCLIIWHDLLTEITRVSIAMQSAEISLDTAVNLVAHLKDYLIQYRENGFEKSVSIARRIAAEFEVDTEFTQKRNRKRKRFHDENNTSDDPQEQDAQTHFKQSVFYVIVDTVTNELSDRFQNLGQIAEKYRFIIEMDNMTQEDMEESVTRYALSTSDVSRDIIQEMYPASRLLNEHRCRKALDKLNFILKRNLDLVFPNLTVALRVFLTMPVTVASAERSFSKLKIVKNYLRSTMDNERLTHLAVISIENKVARSTHFSEILDRWASMKARRVRI